MEYSEINTTEQKFNPISKSARIEIVDILRGFALFGVLIANIPFDHLNVASEDFNEILTLIYNVFINRKFITLFSILFGYGFYIQMTRAKEKSIDFQGYFLKRMGLLFLIGCIHCYLKWNGDILMAYAVGCVFLLLVKNWTVRNLLFFTVFLSVLVTAALFVANTALGWQEHPNDFSLIERKPLVESYCEYLKINLITSQWVNFASDMPVTFAFTFGNMIIGLILGKLEFFKKPKAVKGLTKALAFIGLFIGIPCSYMFHLVIEGRLQLDVSLAWLPFLVIAGMIHQTLGYVALFVMLRSSKFFLKFTAWFKFIGRTALSNYILQSALYLLIIFHAINPNGLYGKLSRAETYAIAIIFFIFQYIISYLWLKRFNQGPLEYYWKKISYHRFK